jgi:hypothetical protein
MGSAERSCRAEVNRLLKACWKDTSLKERFLTDPKTVFAEYGMNAPADIDVRCFFDSMSTPGVSNLRMQAVASLSFLP